jgi:membrane-associated phospholipid phosphatase
MSLKERILFGWRMKLNTGSLTFLFFWIFYFSLPKLSPFTSAQVYKTFIDEIIPLYPSAVYFYIAQFFITISVGWMLHQNEDILSYFKSHISLFCICFLVYFFFPTVMPKPILRIEDNLLCSLIFRYDTIGNAFPSLHAGFCLLSSLYAPAAFQGLTSKTKIYQIAFLSNSIVLISTLLIKQHVLIDLLSGIAIAWGCFFITNKVQVKT